MNWKALLAGVAVFVAAKVSAAELTLFDVELRAATPEQLHRAALAAGASLLNRSGGCRIQDVNKVRLPGARRVEVLFDGERFVIAAYAFDDDSRTDHELRRLLADKYGPTYLILGSGKRHESDLTVRYSEVADTYCDMAPPMQRTCTQHAFKPKKLEREEVRLSYVNPIAFEALEQRLRAAGQQADKAREAQLRRSY